MIIVNQREDIIINFTNVISIYVEEKDVQVLMNCIEDALILGKYATEERAKEVIKEIINIYKFNRKEAVGQVQVVYEMPEK